MDLSKLSDAELDALYAQAKAQQKPKSRLDPRDQAMMDPTADMPWWQQGLAGVGKAFVDTGRGLGQLLPGNLVSRDDVDEAKKRDAALMDTGWGMGGNIVGNVLPMLAAPGATTIPKALMVGAGMGAAQPVGKDDSRIENAIIGGGVNALFPAGAAAYKGARAIAEPVIAPQRTAARLLEQFADDPQAMRLAAKNAKALIPGAEPTLADVAQQPGISTLQRSMFNQPGPMQKAVTDRTMQGNAARVNYLDDLAGTDGKLDFHKASRSAVADELYQRAFAEVPGDTSWIKGEVNKLMQRPAFNSALKDGQEMMLNLGGKVSPDRPEFATEILHYTKLSLDDAIERATAQSKGNSARALIDTRDKLVSMMESKDFSPSYREARDTFKKMSGPVNEMELAGRLREKFIPP
jgi:hypothetical protein